MLENAQFYSNFYCIDYFNFVLLKLLLTLMKKNIKLSTIWTISWSYKNLICGNPAVNSQRSPSPSLVQCYSATPWYRQWQLSCPALAVQSDARSGNCQIEWYFPTVCLSWHHTHAVHHFSSASHCSRFR